MAVALIIEIIETILALAPQAPEIIALGENAVSILRVGTVTPEQESSIRAQLDEIKSRIDAA